LGPGKTWQRNNVRISSLVWHLTDRNTVQLPESKHWPLWASSQVCFLNDPSDLFLPVFPVLVGQESGVSLVQMVPEWWTSWMSVPTHFSSCGKWMFKDILCVVLCSVGQGQLGQREQFLLPLDPEFSYFSNPRVFATSLPRTEIFTVVLLPMEGC
jgi:hypothetical protein